MESVQPIDPERLILEISDGKMISEEEKGVIVSILESCLQEKLIRGFSIDDIYSYILVIGRAKFYDLGHVLERFLASEDALTVALVLEILCIDWARTDDYLERVLSFALGTPWDVDEDVRQTAIKILGNYLHAKMAPKKRKTAPKHTKHVLSLLYSIFQDEEAEHWTRQTAYFALCRASGKSLADLPPPECFLMEFGPDSCDIDREVINQIEGFLSEDK